MAKRWQCAILTALALLSLAPAALWAEPPAGQANARRRVDLKIAQLDERLALSAVSGESGWRNTQLVLAAAQLKLARKLLSRSNLRAAEVVASQAERALARAEEKEAQQ